MSHWYIVCSPEFGVVIPVLDYGQGPTEYGRDCMYVRAQNAQRAKVLMVRARRRFNRIPLALRQRFGLSRRNTIAWLDDAQSDARSPFAGMIAHRSGPPRADYVGASS